MPAPYSSARIGAASGTSRAIAWAIARARSTFVGSSSQVAARASKSVTVCAERDSAVMPAPSRCPRVLRSAPAAAGRPRGASASAKTRCASARISAVGRRAAPFGKAHRLVARARRARACCPGSPLGSSTRAASVAAVGRLDVDLADPAPRIGGVDLGVAHHRARARETRRRADRGNAARTRRARRGGERRDHARAPCPSRTSPGAPSPDRSPAPARRSRPGARAP